jgi:uncharacterized membrane protein YqhA
MSNTLIALIAVFVIFGGYSLFLSYKLDKANKTIRKLKGYK